ncbi:hypothetical protein K438DRAFT_1963779 [Mycena galopus ATCC 62051]|nr:hypothetical protein K438DRAFT_1963779 [Mycena galopus ATCC 62051]
MFFTSNSSDSVSKNSLHISSDEVSRVGARLALVNGTYEFHILHRFDANTPPVVFTTENYDEGYDSPDRPKIPACSSQPSTQPMPLLQPYFRKKGCPTSLDGFLKPDVPLVHVHVATFEGISFVGVTSSHITFDAIGTGIFLRTWTRIMNGEDEDSISEMPWDVAPFESFKGKKVSNRRGWFDLGFLSKLNFIVRFAYRIIRNSEEVVRLICVPKVFLDAAKDEINNQLRLEGSQEWVDTTPIHIHMPMDLHNFPVFPGNSKLSIPYVNNSVLSIAISPISVNAFRTESLASLALRIRRAILAHTADLDWMRSAVHFRCADPFKDVFPAPPGAEYAILTSWRAARFSELDFSGACSVPGGGAKVLAMFGYPTSGKSIPFRDTGALLNEDAEAFWMAQVKGRKEWERIRASGLDFS